MPKYEDLEFIRDKILSIGDEINIKKKLGLSTEILPLPEKKDVIDDKEIQEDFEGFIDEIKEDFDKGLILEEDVEEEPLKKEEEFNIDTFLDTDKKENLDNAFEDILGKEEKSSEEDIISTEKKEEEGIRESDINDLLSGLGLTDEEKKEEKKEESFIDSFSFEKEEPIVESFEESSKEEGGEQDLLSDFKIEEPLFSEKEKVEKESEVEDFLEELNGKKEQSIDDYFKEEKGIGDILVTDDEALKDLAGDFLTTPVEEEKPIFEESLEISKEPIEEEKGSILEEITKEPFEEDKGPIFEEIIEKDQLKETEEEKIEDLLSFEDLDKLVEEKKDESNRAQLIEVGDEVKESPVDINVESLFGEPEDLGDQIKESKEELSGLESISEDMDLSSLDQFEVKKEEKPEEEISSFLSEIPEVEEEVIEQEVEEIEEKEQKVKKEEKIPIGKDEIELTDDEIKKILLSLSSLPKEAELKIARAIVSDKYSDLQLKPLIDALLEKEKPQAIIKIYEKITGDKSLSKVTALKYTGEEFEEKQKSFAYLFQKNILPILYRITAISIFVLIILLLFINVIIPTMRATHYYNIGKKNIDKKKFNEVEVYFERAYEIQPRYGEVVQYARKYRENKRYLEAEKKYNLALRMRENRDLKLEIGDFFRETKDYERSIRYYNDLKQQNDRDIKVLLGMAKTYYDWAEEIPEKLEEARELYYDVLDIDKNNKEAIYGNLNIFIKQKNNNEVLKYYKYIEKKFKDNIDPVTYMNLASYFIETNQMEDVKSILDKSLKKSNQLRLNLPEIDYLYARYNNSLNIFNEEKKHLENALIKFNRMSKDNPDLFGTQKYQRLLARVYNDLGENYDRFSKANIDAEKYYLMAINTDPDYGKPYFNLANFELKYKVDLESAKNNYLQSEERGFVNDRLNYNLGWIYFKQENYIESFKRINRLLEKYPENSNLKFFMGTIFYKLFNFDFAEGFLLETYNYFNHLKDIYAPLEMDVKEDRIIVDMLFKISNNLGATYQKKFEKSRNSKYLIWATKYYSESMEYYDKLKEYPLIEEKREEELTETEVKLKKFEITKATQNLRMVLYPDAGKDEPIIFEDFSLDYESTL